MTAADVDYPSVPSEPVWTILAEGVFHTQIQTLTYQTILVQ
jgi:hypothetical protein